MTWVSGWRRSPALADVQRVRDAVGNLVEAERAEAWLAELPDELLVRFAAPLEMLTFQYHLDPPRGRHLIRAARVACQAMSQHLDACPADLAAALRHVGSAVSAGSGSGGGPTGRG
jgi:hypothetical protein